MNQMLSLFLDELDWAVKAVVLAFAFHFCSIGIAVAGDWSKGTDNYYYYKGDTSAPYEAEAYTVYERKLYYDRYGCPYYKNVAVTKYRYNRVYKITEKTSIDEIALYFAGIKNKEVASELRVREDYAKTQRIRELAEVFGIDQYKLQSFGLNLNYGEEGIYGQYPPQTGNTQYGTRVVHAETYGDTRLPLVEALAMQKEIQLVGKQYASESELAWQNHTREIVDNEGSRISYERQLSAQNETIAVLSDTLLAAIRETKPSGGSLKVEERYYGEREGNYGDDRRRERGDNYRRGNYEDDLRWNDNPPPRPSPLSQADVWRALTKVSCAACHEKHAAVESDHFPEGMHLSRINSFSDSQLSRVAEYIGTASCPPKDNELGVAPLSIKQRKWAVDYVSLLRKGGQE